LRLFFCIGEGKREKEREEVRGTCSSPVVQQPEEEGRERTKQRR
jgi:hypothetical protein